MELTIQGKQIDIGDALREHIQDKIEQLSSKYFNHAAFATVTISKDGRNQIKAHILIQVGKNIMVTSDDVSADAYGSFDTAAEKVAKQLRRYKRRLRDHHDRSQNTPEEELQKARDYVLATEPELTEEEEKEAASQADDPAVIAEMTTVIETLTVSEAVMRMDLGGLNALMFRNVKNNELNMVYRRPDGNIGWIDPEANIVERKKTATA
ncbi:MAG: ribosome-associated translation inhibitor RaiA [Alphaproteobacteria bacterium]|jgi:ribosomal subunit interface protein|nr:ribosome-associated translation inhibitor RaiA [Alphaproteobacteria bacterium]MDP7222217.1 ribosome-associated translation inhibitor RaiA [Alphaproteobacteria bacterium]